MDMVRKFLRSCPYCNGDMHYEGNFLICDDYCQHSQCVVCHSSIHRGGIDDGIYYDQHGNHICYVEPRTERKVYHKP